MKRAVKKMLLLCGGGILCGVAAFGRMPGTEAYLTDEDQSVNQMVFGHNTTEITEEFPEPTPVPPKGSVIKKVKVKNEGSAACYVRAALVFSEPIETLEGFDNENWVKGEDSYYYYKRPVLAGESTTELFTGIRVKEAAEKEALEVYVYEESVQIQKGSEVFPDYLTAWKTYERGDSA